MTHKETVTTQEYTYTAIYTPEQEGGFTVTCTTLPGLVSYGETIGQARTNAAEAIGGYLEGLRKAGDQIPAGDDNQSPHREAITVNLSPV